MPQGRRQTKRFISHNEERRHHQTYQWACYIPGKRVFEQFYQMYSFYILRTHALKLRFKSIEIVTYKPDLKIERRNYEPKYLSDKNKEGQNEICPFCQHPMRKIMCQYIIIMRKNTFLQWDQGYSSKVCAIKTNKAQLSLHS